jgi:hypothetical protein
VGERKKAVTNDVDILTSDLVNYNLRPEDVSEGIACTVHAIAKISVKSIQTLHRAISLLKLFSEEQDLSATFAERSLAMTGKGDVPDSLPDEVVETVSTAAQISVKSCPALFRTISILKFSDEMQVKEKGVAKL